MIDVRNGPSDGASAVERRLMPIPGVFYGGGCCYMACRGLMFGGISDVLLISHGPVGCAYYAGRIAVVFEDIFRSDAFATMALELGMDVVMIAPDYAAQHCTDQGFCMNVPVALAERVACSGFSSGERRASLPGCEHALRPVSARDADWVRATFSSREVTDALSILNPDICFAGVEQRFGRIRTPMRSEKFLSDERGTDYGGFEGFMSFARDLAIASELGHWLDTEPSWLTEGRQDG